MKQYTYVLIVHRNQDFLFVKIPISFLQLTVLSVKFNEHFIVSVKSYYRFILNMMDTDGEKNYLWRC